MLNRTKTHKNRIFVCVFVVFLYPRDAVSFPSPAEQNPKLHLCCRRYEALFWMWTKLVVFLLLQCIGEAKTSSSELDLFTRFDPKIWCLNISKRPRKSRVFFANMSENQANCGASAPTMAIEKGLDCGGIAGLMVSKIHPINETWTGLQWRVKLWMGWDENSYSGWKMYAHGIRSYKIFLFFIRDLYDYVHLGYTEGYDQLGDSVPRGMQVVPQPLICS